MEFQFVIADPHLGHENVVRHCERGFDNVRDWNDFFVSRWNETVPRDATTVVIGDFAWRDHAKWVQALNGKIILVPGNHDDMPAHALRQFTRVTQPIWDTRQDNIHITFCHYPMMGWRNKSHGQILLHGHSHGRTIEYDDIRRMDCGVDASPFNFAPFPWEYIKFKMATKIPPTYLTTEEQLKQRVRDLRASNQKILEAYHAGNVSQARSVFGNFVPESKVPEKNETVAPARA